MEAEVDAGQISLFGAFSRSIHLGVAATLPTHLHNVRVRDRDATTATVGTRWTTTTTTTRNDSLKRKTRTRTTEAEVGEAGDRVGDGGRGGKCKRGRTDCSIVT